MWVCRVLSSSNFNVIGTFVCYLQRGVFFAIFSGFWKYMHLEKAFLWFLGLGFLGFFVCVFQGVV